MTGWYRNFAAALTGPHHVPEPLNHHELADQRLIDAVRHDLGGEDGQATATAVRMIWTGDHLDAAAASRTRSPDPPNRRSAARPHTSCDQRLTPIGTAVGRLPARSAVATA